MLKITKWEISPLQYKKYRVHLSDGTHVDFGDKRYQHYKDKSPLKAFSHLDHNDEERRMRYYQRHKRVSEKFSADYMSKKYLW